MVLIAAGAIILLMFNTGVYTGLFASIMLAMTIGIQNVRSFASDEKAIWKKYQLAMPVSAVSVVTSKYLAIVCTLAISLVGSVFLIFYPLLFFVNFDSSVWGVSMAASVIAPLL